MSLIVLRLIFQTFLIPIQILTEESFYRFTHQYNTLLLLVVMLANNLCLLGTGLES